MRSALYFLILFGSSSFFSQKNKDLTFHESSVPAEQTLSSKLVFTKHAHSPVYLPGTHYNAYKNGFPYYQELKNTAAGFSAKPILANIKTVTLSQESSQKILSLYKEFISSDFSIEQETSQDKKGLTHFAKINPFKLNANNTIDELVSYQINWQIIENSFSKSPKVTVASSFKNNSVLASGNWYKIAITKTGMHKIDKTFLKNMGLDIDNINPKNIRVYGNGGHMLPEYNGNYRPDDLEENAIMVVGENDNIFNNNDYIVFYGLGTEEWKRNLYSFNSCLKFTHQVNYYSDTSYYYITADLGPGKRVSDISSLSSTPTNTTNTYDYYDFHEKNNTNFIKSGREFYGEYFDISTSYNFNFQIPNLVVGDTVFTEVKLAARAGIASSYNLSYCGSTFSISANGVNVNDYLGDYASLTKVCNYAIMNNSSIINFNITKLTSNAVAWLDYIRFNCRRYLTFNGSQFNFRDKNTAGLGKTTKFNLTASNPANLLIWDISDPYNAKNQLYNLNGTQIDYTVNHDSIKENIVFNGSDYYTPIFVSKIANQNLHGVAQADYVIVSHPLFLSQAQRLAQVHQVEDSLNVSVVTTEQIYNEFSSGKQDIVAIRDYVRMLYKRNLSSGKEVKYLLLFGDGSFKVKEKTAFGNTSFIPIWSNKNSENPTLSTVSDDFFCWMDDNEGDYQNTERVDVGAGRFPVKNISEATAAVNKVIAYYKKNYAFSLNTPSSCDNTGEAYPQGDWRNKICFIADDEDGSQHIKTAELLAAYVKKNHNEYNIDKLYADAFLQYTTPGGQRYPDVSEGIDQKFKSGSLVLNYTGHGGEVGLGHERFIEISQIQNYKNINNMPLFITATCEFSRFDDPDRTSAGELCFLNANGAAVALFTTVRVAYTNTNEILLLVLYQKLFTPLANGKMPALGDLIRDTKHQAGVNFYYLNFHLLGDPALRLSYPQQGVFTTEINSTPVTSGVNDTIKALQKVTIKGYVGTKAGSKLSNFNGVVYPSVFDKSQSITCLGNDQSSLVFSGGQLKPYTFKLQKNIIYKGKAQVKNGDFSFTFIVPKDITYSLDTGKVSYYATNGVTDANGLYTNIVIGGSASNPYIDEQGPNVGLYLNDKKFVSGGTTNEKPNLYAEVIDSSGINTAGTGIGHDLTAILDENSNKPIILNDYYEADLDSYQSGKIRYPFNTLSEGNHRLSLKVWDVQNNSTTAYTDFVVAPSAEMALTHVLNYPNPFTTKTQFFFENNQCCLDLKVNVQIYTISGKVVKTISKQVRNEGFRSDAIEWDGKDDYGDKLAKGVYIYKITVTDPESKKAEKTEKLVILN